jgi:hypothetical protein
MGNKKAKLARDEVPAMERLQSSIHKCIAGVVTNIAAREVKFDGRWAMMFVKHEVKIGLLKTNVAVIKRKEDLALLTTDTSSMCVEVKAWHKAQCEVILAEIRLPPASSNTTLMPNPSETPNGEAPTDEEDEEVEEVFGI